MPARYPSFHGGQTGRRSSSTGDVIATGGAPGLARLFPRFVITFVTVTICTTRKLSDQHDVTCHPRRGLSSAACVFDSRRKQVERRIVRGMIRTGHLWGIGSMHTRLSTIANILKWETSRESHVSAETSAKNDMRDQRGHHEASENVIQRVNQHTTSVCISRRLVHFLSTHVRYPRRAQLDRPRL